MFEIRILSSLNQSKDLARGEICLGEFRETFEVSLGHWTPSRYEQQWMQGVSRILKGNDRSCLITSITDPRTANFIFWWPVYCVGTDCLFQNQVLFLDALSSRFDDSEPYSHISERISTTEEGVRISEWTVPMRDLRDWYDCRMHASFSTSK